MTGVGVRSESPTGCSPSEPLFPTTKVPLLLLGINTDLSSFFTKDDDRDRTKTRECSLLCDYSCQEINTQYKNKPIILWGINTLLHPVIHCKILQKVTVLFLNGNRITISKNYFKMTGYFTFLDPLWRNLRYGSEDFSSLYPCTQPSHPSRESRVLRLDDRRCICNLLIPPTVVSMEVVDQVRSDPWI